MKNHRMFVITLVLLSSMALTAPLLAASPQSDKSSHAVVQIDINSAGPEELQVIPGIGVALAERIVTYRKEHGAFKSARELTSVRGIGEKSLAKLLPWVAVR